LAKAGRPMTGADAWIIGMVLACVLGAFIIGRGRG
jgi:hypothetical protein